jgi:hypothetical protein
MVQFWDLYVIRNEKIIVLVHTWVDGELRLTFRRNFDEEMMQAWYDLEATVENIVLNDSSDALVWSYNSSGVYSSQSFYAIVNYRGVTPIYILAVWSVNVSPKIQLFFWLLSHNKLAMVDNLSKKGMQKPE